MQNASTYLLYGAAHLVVLGSWLLSSSHSTNDYVYTIKVIYKKNDAPPKQDSRQSTLPYPSTKSRWPKSTALAGG